MQRHTGEVGVLGTVLLRVYSGTILPIFIEIGSYLTDKDQKISWHSFFWDTVYIHVKQSGTSKTASAKSLGDRAMLRVTEIVRLLAPVSRSTDSILSLKSSTQYRRLSTRSTLRPSGLSRPSLTKIDRSVPSRRERSIFATAPRSLQYNVLQK